VTELLTERLRLVDLSLGQLMSRLNSPCQLENELGLILAQRVLTKPECKAIGIKIRNMERHTESYHPWFTFWLISVKKNHYIVGMVGFKGNPNTQGLVEIGYGINPHHQNQGYATEAVRAMIAWAFQHPTCKAVLAETKLSNLASQRVLVKAGMRIYKETDHAILWRIDCN
jgi:ribosomal protein S18 acetylase RimI-like enzyme